MDYIDESSIHGCLHTAIQGAEMNKHCHVDIVQKSATLEELVNANKVVLTIQGMGCPNCAARVHNSLIVLKGVINADVDHPKAVAEVEYNPEIVLIPALVDAVAQAGNDGRHRYTVISFT